MLTASQMNAVGLWRVTSCTVSSVGGTAATASNGVVTIGTSNTSVTVSNAFSSDFDAYKIIISGGAGSGVNNMRLQLGNSTTGYYDGLLYVQTNAVTTPRADGADNTNTAWDRMGVTDPNGITFSVDLYSPFLAKYTTCMAIYAFVSGGDAYVGPTTGIHAVASSYSSFTVSLAAGNISGGNIRVYGYRT